MTKPRFAPAELPQRMRSLPLDHRGFPVPWFVAWLDGEGKLANRGEPGTAPDFRVIDTRKFVMAIRRRLCWLCGRPLGSYLAFVIGPMCAVNRITSEPACHRDCAEFAVWACPFLAQPRMRRNEHELPGGMIPAAGVHIDHNPGAMALWITKSFEVVEPQHGQPGVLLYLGEPVSLDWFAEGRPATRAEVEGAIAKGLPKLRAVAEAQGSEAVAALDRMIVEFRHRTGLAA